MKIRNIMATSTEQRMCFVFFLSGCLFLSSNFKITVFTKWTKCFLLKIFILLLICSLVYFYQLNVWLFSWHTMKYFFYLSYEIYFIIFRYFVAILMHWIFKASFSFSIPHNVARNLLRNSPLVFCHVSWRLRLLAIK